MGHWLRRGRRLEWALVIFTALSALLFGSMFTNRAPANIRWMVWIYIGGFYTVMLVLSLFLVQSLRRRGIIASDATAASTHGEPSRRLKVYVAAAAVTALSAVEQARFVVFRQRLGATTSDIFLWNFVALAVLITIAELFQRRKGHSSNTRS